MKKISNKILLLITAIIIFINIFMVKTVALNEGATKTTYDEKMVEIVRDIVQWKETNQDINIQNISEKYKQNAATTENDWYIIALSRLGIEGNCEAYLRSLTTIIQNKYKSDGCLSNIKATEYHRITLAMLSCGGDPMQAGEINGKPINLIKDGTYDRELTASLGKQGLNGWIWGLIALDSKEYNVPEDSCYNRTDIIEEILSYVLPSGGFSIAGNSLDVDITAMAITAMAKYYNQDTIYTIKNKYTDKTNDITIKEVIDVSLEKLSGAQLENGDFESFGQANVESTCQVIMALCSMNIDPYTDARFIKNNNTLFHGINRYIMPDGGVAHIISESSNASNTSNSMSCDQTLLAFTAVLRQHNQMNTLFDFSTENKALTQIYPSLTVNNESAKEKSTKPIVAAVCIFVLTVILIILFILLARRKRN